MKRKPMLETADVEPMLGAARDAARALGLAVSIAIVDDGGYPLRLERMDGAGVMTPSAALAKARTSALTRVPTQRLAARLSAEPELLRLTDYLPMQGGVPIMVEDVCVGGIGVSGGPVDKDEAIAAAGCAALAGAA